MMFQPLVVALFFAVQPGIYSLNDLAHGQTKNSVVTKVVQMLAEEKDKIGEDLKAERASMDEYFNFCHREEDEKNYQVGRSNRKIEDTTALIDDNTAQIEALDEEIADLGTEMAKLVATQEKEDERRANGTAEFKQREMEQTVMTEELGDLQTSLEKQMEAMTTPPPVEGSVPAVEEATAFVQVNSQRAPGFWASAYAQAKQEFVAKKKEMSEVHVPQMTREEARVKAASMLQALGTDDFDATTLLHLRDAIGLSLTAISNAVPDKDGAFVQQEAAPATATISNEHYDMHKKNNEANLAAFKGLKEKAEQALQRERDQESEDQHEYMLDKQARSQEIHLNEDKTEEAKEQRAALQEEKANAEKERADAEAAKAADMKYLEVLLAECETGSAAWDKRQEEAAAEQAAILKAMEILQAGVKVFLQISQKEPVMIPADKAATQEARVRQTLINHFRNLGTKLHSISMLNLVNAASVDPMEKVKGLIKNLIEKLQTEAAEAASTHKWCEEENKKNMETKEKTTDKLKTIEVRLEKATARKNELLDNIETLTEECAEIDSADAEATKIRNEEHTTFVKSEADFKAAAQAVLDAIDVLKDFYGDLSLMQIATTTTSPIAFQAPDLGGAKKDSAGGILGILDTMADEFSKTVAELQSTEREKKKAYDKMTNENAVAKASKEAEIKGAESEVAQLTIAQGQHADDKTMTEDEMKALLEYIEKLKPTCVGVVMPYAERKAKREAEIEGLKQALTILEETQGTLATVSFLQVKPHQA